MNQSTIQLERQVSFAIATLGCKVNQYDSLAIARQLRAHGLRQVAFHQHADAYIVDTCTVTAMADRKSRKTFSRAVRKNPNAVFAVTGCAVEWAADQFRQIQPDCLVVGNREKPQLAERLLSAMHAKAVTTACDGEMIDSRWKMPEVSESDDDTRVGAESFPRPSAGLQSGKATGVLRRFPSYPPYTGERTGNGLCDVRAALKVQDGCNRACTYCIIPAVRGAPYSRPMRELIRETNELVAEGAREIVLTGVLLGTYGFEQSWRRRRERHPLAELMCRLHEIDDLLRLRLSTIDPRDVHDEVIETLAALPKCCPHLHLPLQSGSDAVLRLMKRGYTCADYAQRVQILRSAMPHMGLTTDIMVGFPGETDQHFEETLRFAREMRFSGIHVFPFSSRPGTAAEAMGNAVTPSVAELRVHRLLELSHELAGEFATNHLNQPQQFLVEERSENGNATGLTRDYVRITARTEAATGQLAVATPTRWNGHMLVA